MVDRSCKAPNLFLTGEIRVGKSTLLKEVVREQGWRRGGFQTRPVLDFRGVCGYGLEPFGTEEERMPPLIARRTGRGFEALPLTFDGLGCSLLFGALDRGDELIVMDEIGFFESRAREFHKAVLACLDSPIPVLGVLKKSEALLPRKVRGRADVVTVEVTRQNRDELLHDIVRVMTR